MKLKTLLFTTTLAVSLHIAAPSSALVVSDPGAYSRFATMLTNDNKQLAELTQQLEEQRKILNSLTGNVKRGLGVKDELGKLNQKIQDVTSSFQDIPELADFELETDQIDGIRKMFDALYDPDQDLGKAAVTMKQREAYKERTIKGLLENSEFLMAQQQESIKRFEDLSEEINETESLKDSTDLLNRLLTELLIVNQQQLEIMAQQARMNAALNYEGTQSETGDSTRPGASGNFDTYIKEGKDWSDQLDDQNKESFDRLDSKSKDRICKILGKCP